MAETPFENDLAALFAEPPPMRETEQFAADFERSLGRDWALRRVLIGGLGAIGGMVAAGQIALSTFSVRLDSLVMPDVDAVMSRVNALTPEPLVAAGFSGETLLMTGAMALAAVVMGLARLIREI